MDILTFYTRHRSQKNEGYKHNHWLAHLVVRHVSSRQRTLQVSCECSRWQPRVDATLTCQITRRGLASSDKEACPQGTGLGGQSVGGEKKSGEQSSRIRISRGRKISHLGQRGVQRKSSLQVVVEQEHRIVVVVVSPHLAEVMIWLNDDGDLQCPLSVIAQTDV